MCFCAFYCGDQLEVFESHLTVRTGDTNGPTATKNHSFFMDMNDSTEVCEIVNHFHHQYAQCNFFASSKCGKTTYLSYADNQVPLSFGPFLHKIST